MPKAPTRAEVDEVSESPGFEAKIIVQNERSRQRIGLILHCVHRGHYGWRTLICFYSYYSHHTPDSASDCFRVARIGYGTLARPDCPHYVGVEQSDRLLPHREAAENEFVEKLLRARY